MSLDDHAHQGKHEEPLKDATINVEYLLPASETEEENVRLNIQHDMLFQLKGNKLYTSPLREPPRFVLDLGCGTGIWAKAVAEKHPQATVVGIDLTPPKRDSGTPDNCYFLQGNIEKNWDEFLDHSPGQKRFDLIHASMLVLGVRNFDAFIQNCYIYLIPGGFFESLEGVPKYRRKPQEHMRDGSDMDLFQSIWERRCKERGITMDTLYYYPNTLYNHDFVQVHHQGWQVRLGRPENVVQLQQKWTKTDREISDKMFLSSYLALPNIARSLQIPQEITNAARKDLEENHIFKNWFVEYGNTVGQKPFYAI